MKHNKKSFLKRLSCSLFSALLIGCAGSKDNKNTYCSISQEEAAQIMRTEKNYIILDVRTEAEYAEEHITGAMNVPNESIGTEPPASLPDKNQLILVYCRSGRRSKQAAQKLADMGYTNIKEFGGIQTWTGSTESLTAMTEPVLMLDAHPVTEKDGISAEVTGVTVNEVEVTLKNHSGNVWYYGEPFTLSREENGERRELKWPEEISWIEIAYELPDGGETVIKRDISGLNVTEPGVYWITVNGIDVQFELVMSE